MEVVARQPSCMLGCKVWVVILSLLMLFRDQLLKMSARELKSFIEQSGGSTVGLLEKPELLERAMGLL